MGRSKAEAYHGKWRKNVVAMKNCNERKELRLVLTSEKRFLMRCPQCDKKDLKCSANHDGRDKERKRKENMHAPGC